MDTQTNTKIRVTCPSCNRKAKRVSPVTLRALLKHEFARGFGDGDDSCCSSNGSGDTGCSSISADTGWRFCESQDCDVVYFSEDGDRAFTKPQLRVTVGVKEKTGDRPLCYCFGHTVASIKKKLLATGRSDALEDIRSKMKGPGCHCETANPSGACCLGSVAKGIEIATNELEIADLPQMERPPNPSKNRGELIAKVGTVISAIMASTCCWLPLLLLAVGVSGVGIASILEAYRPVFIVVTFGFLSAAFYFTYRPRHTTTAEGDCCESQATANPNCRDGISNRRLGLMSVNKVMLWLVTILAALFLFFPNYVGVFLGTGDGQTVTPNMTQTTIRIEGMTCEGCSAVVAKAIRKVSGVLAVEVNYEERRAVVGTEACCPVPDDEILAALKSAGYSGIMVETPSVLSPLDRGQAKQNQEIVNRLKR
ncbi:MAG: cation transporter [Planctomycetaceae bacterium]|nr:cation transporter [Planctomycetales bacterium]MCB9925293.1 cation transporter [Planctomycetaceae bacterium]